MTGPKESKQSGDGDRWQLVGELGIDAATCAIWDRTLVPADFRMTDESDAPSLPVALVSTVGDDIDGPVEISADPERGDVIGVRMEFVDDVADLPSEWVSVGELHLPSGHMVIADPYCSPTVPYRQHLDVRAGRWIAEEFHYGGDLEGVRVRWIADLPHGP